MKKLTTMIACIALLVLMALSVSALQFSDVTIGDDDQDRRKNISKTFTVTNDAASDVTATFSSTADARFNIRFDPISATILTGQGVTVKVTGDIPLDFDAVEKSKSSTKFLDEVAFEIGIIEAKIGGVTNASAKLNMQAVNQLEIKKARIECGTKSESLDDGDRIDNLKPDMQCTIEIEVENNFDDDDDEDDQGNELLIGDIDFDSVDVEIEIDDRDLDVDEDDDLDGLSADDEDEVGLDFEIEDDTDDGTYTMEIRVIGKDDNDATHGELWKIKLEVERLTHDLQLRSPTISPSRISACDGGSIRVTSRIINVGKRDEDEAAVELSIPDIKFNKRIDQIELDEDDSTSVNFIADVPADTRAGIYRAILSTFFDNTAPSNSQALEFTVDKCEEEDTTVVITPDDTQTGTTGTTTATGTGTTDPTAATGAVAAPRARVRSSGFTDSPAYLWLLGVLGVVLLIIIIVLLVVAFRKPRPDVL